MATIRERQKGVWEVRVFTGRDSSGRPTQTSRTLKGTTRHAQRSAASLESRPATNAGGRTVADVLKAWVEVSEATWTAASRRDQGRLVKVVLADRQGHTLLAPTVVDTGHRRGNRIESWRPGTASRLDV